MLKKKQGGYQSGQLGRTVNPLSYDFAGSNPAPPTINSKWYILNSKMEFRI